jgi:hypothetical protein
LVVLLVFDSTLFLLGGVVGWNAKFRFIAPACLVVAGWWVSTRCWVLRGHLAGLVLVGVVLGLLLVVVA